MRQGPRERVRETNKGDKQDGRAESESREESWKGGQSGKVDGGGEADGGHCRGRAVTAAVANGDGLRGEINNDRKGSETAERPAVRAATGIATPDATLSEAWVA